MLSHKIAHLLASVTHQASDQQDQYTYEAPQYAYRCGYFDAVSNMENALQELPGEPATTLKAKAYKAALRRLHNTTRELLAGQAQQLDRAKMTALTFRAEAAATNAQRILEK